MYGSLHMEDVSSTFSPTVSSHSLGLVVIPLGNHKPKLCLLFCRHYFIEQYFIHLSIHSEFSFPSSTYFVNINNHLFGVCAQLLDTKLILLGYEKQQPPAEVTAGVA